MSLGMLPIVEYNASISGNLDAIESLQAVGGILIVMTLR
jgi:hypothetical protein